MFYVFASFALLRLKDDKYLAPPEIPSLPRMYWAGYGPVLQLSSFWDYWKKVVIFVAVLFSCEKMNTKQRINLKFLVRFGKLLLKLSSCFMKFRRWCNVKISGVWVAQEVPRKKRGCWIWFQEREAVNKQNQWKCPACDRKSSQWLSPYCSDDNKGILDMNNEKEWRIITKDLGMSHGCSIRTMLLLTVPWASGNFWPKIT